MMNLIEKFFSKDRQNKSQLRQNFRTHFYSQPEHAWVLETGAVALFDELFSRLPAGILEAMMSKYPMCFVPHEKLSTKTSGLTGMNTIVIFPAFKKLLLSSKRSGLAYLAHELAFVLYELEGENNDPLMAEVEADKFVCDLGLMNELEELLLMLDETIEKRLRLTYLTARHFAQES